MIMRVFADTHYLEGGILNFNFTAVSGAGSQFNKKNKYSESIWSTGSKHNTLKHVSFEHLEVSLCMAVFDERMK